MRCHGHLKGESIRWWGLKRVIRFGLMDGRFGRFFYGGVLFYLFQYNVRCKLGKYWDCEGVGRCLLSVFEARIHTIRRADLTIKSADAAKIAPWQYEGRHC